MKKSFILLMALMLYALLVTGQKNDSAFIKALNQTFDFPQAESSADINSDVKIDTNIKAEYEDRYYWPGRVLISFTQEHYQGLKETKPLADLLVNVQQGNGFLPANNILQPLGIDYSLMCFKRCRWSNGDTNQIEFIMVETKPGQKVIDAIKDIKKHSLIKIRSVDPEWFPDAYPGSWN